MQRRKPRPGNVKELIVQLQKEGWTVEHSKGGHYKITSPRGGVVFVGATPSDHRALRNVERYLKREGWKPRAK